MNYSVMSVPGFGRQLMCSLVLASTYLSMGCSSAWPNAIPKIVNDTYLSFHLTGADIRWIISTDSLSSLFGPIITGVLMEPLGPRRLVNWCVLPTIFLWIIMAYVPSKIALYVGRIGIGLINSIIITVAPPLSAELTSPEIRGMLGTMRMTASATGVLIMYIMIAFLPWKLATVLSAVPLVPVFVIFFFVPESPYWLVRKGRDSDALKALTLLRGPNGDSRSELDRIKKANEEQPSDNSCDQVRLKPL
ncbi:facilitated trehalose transporter Tret1-like [Oratosquilla oratoria]|uniref:facilitated trehalose transporter Tret1-like n=1 Tax=Oratosquilla oratoria TaxID=337810 RepID=UPI003F75E50B